MLLIFMSECVCVRVSASQRVSPAVQSDRWTRNDYVSRYINTLHDKPVSSNAAIIKVIKFLIYLHF